MTIAGASLSHPPSLRRRVFDLLEVGRFAGPWAAAMEVFLVVLILVTVAAVALETIPGLEARYSAVFSLIERVSVTLFSLEYLARVWIAVEHDPDAARLHPWRARLKYCLSPLALIDLVAILPFFLAAAGGDWFVLRLFRLVRLLKLVRYSPALSSLVRVLYGERRILLAALVIMVGALFAAATALYLIEGDVPNSDFASIPDALWWAIATLTTVGYGDVVPTTAMGKVAGGLVMLFGLAFYALPIGILASGFSDELRRRQFVVPVAALKGMPLFAGLEEAGLSDVATHLRSVAVGAGTVLVHRREEDAGLYLILKGWVRLYVDGQAIRLGAGDYFGDHGPVYDQGGQPAAVADSEARLLHLSARDMDMALALYPGLGEAVIRVAEAELERLTQHGLITPEDRDMCRAGVRASLSDEKTERVTP